MFSESSVNYLDTSSKNNFTYTLSSFITGCLFWDEETDNWSNDGCAVSIVYNDIVHNVFRTTTLWHDPFPRFINFNIKLFPIVN